MTDFGVGLEGVTGPREILPESLWTGLTRIGYTATTWHASEKRAIGTKISNQEGIWLPNIEDSENDLKTLSLTIGKSSRELLLENDTHDKLADLIGSIAVNEEGCWVSQDSQAGIIDLANFDIKKPVLEQENDLQFLKHCSTENCNYHRHYDLTPSVKPSDRRVLLYPNLDHFKSLEDGVLTSWGDILPSVQNSREALRKFQLKCMPFVERNQSFLSAYQVSQISLLPDTGCWFANNYFMTPVEMTGYENWQYDAYSRLRVPSSISEKYVYKTFALLGHRVVWLLSGNKLPDPKEAILNHRCGFRPCVNPGHIDPISPQENNLHGQLMSQASKLLSGEKSKDQAISEMERYASILDIDPQNIEIFWQ